MDAVRMLMQPTVLTGEITTKSQKAVNTLGEGQEDALFSFLLAKMGTDNPIFSDSIPNPLNSSTESESAELSLLDLFKSLNLDSEEFMKVDEDKIENYLQSILVESPIQLNQEEYAKLGQQLVAILANFEDLLSTAQASEDIKKIAPKILELLQQWSMIEQKMLSSNTVTDQVIEGEGTNVKVNQAWHDILQAYQKRTKLMSKQQFQSDAQVTTKDVVKWIENALKNQPLSDKPIVSGEMNYQNNGVMHKLEQYVIYVNPNQSGHTVEQQLMEQFQQVIKTSKFLAMPNGINQLSIALRPENLGEMMVRLTEINGEMTVKIVVSTQAAKEMLESNMHQLRHMFSPQQVIIERQDVTGGQAQNQSKEDNDQPSFNEQGQSNSDQSNHPEKNSNGEDFEARLSELIYEKV